MYSATAYGVGISNVQRCVVATCQKASSNSGTISASTIGLTRRHSDLGRLAETTAGSALVSRLASAIVMAGGASLQ